MFAALDPRLRGDDSAGVLVTPPTSPGDPEDTPPPRNGFRRRFLACANSKSLGLSRTRAARRRRRSPLAILDSPRDLENSGPQEIDGEIRSWPRCGRRRCVTVADAQNFVVTRSPGVSALAPQRHPKFLNHLLAFNENYHYHDCVKKKPKQGTVDETHSPKIGFALRGDNFA